MPRQHRAQLDGGAQPLVGERRRHPHVDDHDVGIELLDRRQQAPGVAERADDLVVVLGEDPGDALAQQHGVLGDHDAHGSSTTSIGRPALGAGDPQPALDGEHPVAEPGESAAGDAAIGAAAPVVAHLDDDRCSRLGRRRCSVTRTDARVRAAVLGDVGQRLGDDEVRGRLDRRRGVGRRARPVDRRRAPGCGRRARTARRRARGRSARCGWMPRTRSRSSAIASLASSWARVDQLRRPRSGSCPLASRSLARPRSIANDDQALLRAVVEVALDPAQLRRRALHRRVAADGQLLDPLARAPSSGSARASRG